MGLRVLVSFSCANAFIAVCSVLVDDNYTVFSEHSDGQPIAPHAAVNAPQNQ